MPRFAANLSMLFTQLPFLDRFAAATAAGVSVVEYLFPYDFDAEVLAGRPTAHGLAQVLYNLPAGDWAASERGIACHPGRVEEFRAGVDKAIAYATALGCPRLNCLVGKLPVGVAAAEAREVLVANLTRISHIQLAGNPDRHEPGSGEIAYSVLLPFLDATIQSGRCRRRSSRPAPRSTRAAAKSPTPPTWYLLWCRTRPTSKRCCSALPASQKGSYRQDRRRHEFDLADRHQGLRPPH
ncbi:TIM barrel protein [Pleomorphomonas koreensis]|uniref:TIM barrel protein n=1 Tax=Pleomorphomonas koreensis TaxID=257440 RepID=UPI00041AFB6A